MTEFSKEHMNALLEEVYKYGASPELVYLPLSNALLYGLIGKWEYRVRCLMQRLHIPQPAIRFKRTNELTAFSEGFTRGYQKGREAALSPFVSYTPTRDPNRAPAPPTTGGQSPPPCS